MAEKKQFDCNIKAIQYYEPIRLLTPTKFLFFWLTRLSPFVGPSMDLKHTKNKSYSENDIRSNKLDNKKL